MIPKDIKEKSKISTKELFEKDTDGNLIKDKDGNLTKIKYDND